MHTVMMLTTGIFLQLAFLIALHHVNMLITEHCCSLAKLLKDVKPEFKAADGNETSSFTKTQKKKNHNSITP